MMTDYKVIDTPWVRCPECGKVFKGEIGVWEDFPAFADYTNFCPFCNYIIMESEFEEIKFDKGDTQWDS